MDKQANIALASSLQLQINHLEQAIAILSDSGRITSMTTATAEGVEPGQVVSVETANMASAPELIAEIVTLMQAELDRLNNALARL